MAKTSDLNFHFVFAYLNQNQMYILRYIDIRNSYNV